MPEAAHISGSPMLELLGFISYLITLYTYVVIAVVIVSWLMALESSMPTTRWSARSGKD